MTKQIKLPCGLSSENKLIYIDEAKNGLSCECVCPGCKQPLVAKNNGKKKEHHFAHKSKDYDCEHGYQSALHYMAKDLFLEMQYLTFVKNGKPVQYKIDTVELERKVDEIIPDILVACDGKQFIVEIYVTHVVDDEKKQKIKDLKISAIEIDLSRFHKEMIDKDTLKTELSNANNFSWIYDADIDLIEQKKEIIQQFGMRLKLLSYTQVNCPFATQKTKGLPCRVDIRFCKKCTYCYREENKNYIQCGYSFPMPLSSEERRKMYLDVVVNENKVMFANEFKNYYESFMKNMFANVSIPVTLQMRLR